jgi:acyl transferase domain-containing protein
MLADGVCLAAVNGPSQCVVSGGREAIEAFEARLRDEAVTYQRLQTAGAFHSELMAGVVEPLVAAAREVRAGRPRIPYVSNVTGTWIDEADLQNPGYWGRHVRETVRFSASVDTLLTWGAGVFLEVGPGQALSALIRQHGKAREGAAANVAMIPSLPSAREAASDAESVVRALGRLWLAGVVPDWSAYHAGERRLRVELPTYPFERKRYWAEPTQPAQARVSRVETAAPSRGDLDAWFAMPSWTRSLTPPLQEEHGGYADRCLVFLDGSPAGEQLADRLNRRGHALILVRPGNAFAQMGADEYVINPSSRNDYDALVTSLRGADRTPGEVLHLWGLTGRNEPRTDDAFADRCETRGFYTLLCGDRFACCRRSIQA